MSYVRSEAARQRQLAVHATRPGGERSVICSHPSGQRRHSDAKVVEALDAAGIKHMVTGSFAITFHGEPRMTQDIDVVIDPDVSTVALFVGQLDPDTFYVDDAVSFPSCLQRWATELGIADLLQTALDASN